MVLETWNSRGKDYEMLESSGSLAYAFKKEGVLY